jgi:hypothetical protein
MTYQPGQGPYPPGQGPYQPGRGPYQPNNGFYQQQPSMPPITIEPVAPTDGPEGDAEEEKKKKKPGRRLRVFLIVSGALVVLVAVTWAFGGLRTRPSGPERLRAGSTVNQGLFDVQILDARAGKMKSDSFEPATNQLVVRMRVTDLGDQSYGITTFTDGIAAEPKPGTFVAPDLMKSNGVVKGYDTSTIHPRLPVIVELVWPLPEAKTLDSVTVALRQWSHGQSFTTDTIDWTVGKDSPIQAEVSVPVRTGATS